MSKEYFRILLFLIGALLGAIAGTIIIHLSK